MNIETADEIITAWGKFMEVAYPQQLKLFRSAIPESLLPYSKEDIEEALNIGIKIYNDEGNEDVAQALSLTLAALIVYCDDNEAFADVARRKLSDQHFKS